MITPQQSLAYNLLSIPRCDSATIPSSQRDGNWVEALLTRDIEDTGMSTTSITLIIVGLLVVFFVAIYNKLVRLKNLVEEGWSGIDVQLKRRANLIPNLIETVKGYMGHERELLAKVTELRAQSMSAQDVGEKGRLEGLLSRSLANVFAVAEGYPDLKANQNFLDLQNQLSDIEDQIQLARRYYNGTVRNLNIKVESFPSNIVAGMFNFVKAEFFEIEDQADRAVPSVQF
jgi:LemA protein